MSEVESRIASMEREWFLIGRNNNLSHPITEYSPMYYEPIPGVHSAFRVLPSRPSTINTFTTNGMRPYPDVSHYETAMPECSGIDEAALYSVASSYFIEAAIKNHLAGFVKLNSQPDLARISVHGRKMGLKSSNTSAFHENYSVHIPEWEKDQARDKVRLSIARHIGPAIIGRTLFNGAGHVAPDEKGRPVVQPAQRMRTVTSEMHAGAQQTSPLILSREENFTGDTKDRLRLQIVAGDYCLSPWANRATFGVASIALRAWENGLGGEIAITNLRKAAIESATKLNGSIDVVYKGKRMNLTQNEILKYYLELGRELAGKQLLSPDEEAFLPDWEKASDQFDDDPLLLEDATDWAKKQVVQNSMYSRGKTNSENAMYGLDYAFDPVITDDERTRIGWQLRERGGFRDHFTSDQINRALHHPPEKTRAKHRSELITVSKRVSDSNKKTINWDLVAVSTKDTSHEVRLSREDGKLSDQETEDMNNYIKACENLAA